nr:MFS transporter [Alkalilimnicola ehrlichii]
MSDSCSKAWSFTLPAALLLMAPFNILASLAMDIYLPIVPAMPDVLDTTPSVIQLTLSLYIIVLGVGQVIFGPLSDRIGRRPILLIGSTLFAMASFSLAATTDAATFVLLRLLQAADASAILVALFATVRDVYAERPESAVIYSLLNSMLAFVPALGPIAGAVIADIFVWRGIFLALALPMLVLVSFASLKWHETRPPMQHSAQREAAFVPILKTLRSGLIRWVSARRWARFLCFSRQHPVF